MEYVITKGDFKQITSKACVIKLGNGEEAVLPLSQIIVQKKTDMLEYFKKKTKEEIKKLL